MSPSLSASAPVLVGIDLAKAKLDVFVDSADQFFTVDNTVAGVRQVSLAGLAPINRDSGTMRGRQTTWGGRAAVRCALYMGAVSAWRCNPTLRRFGERLKATGKPFKVVITAVMRKLLTILNVLLRENRPWRNEIAFQNA